LRPARRATGRVEGTNTAEDTAVAASPELSAWRVELRLRAIERLQRTPVRPPRWVRLAAVALLLVFHATVLVGLRQAMFASRPRDQPVVQVELIDVQAEPALPEPPLRRESAPRTVRPAPRQPPPRAETVPAEPETLRPHLFNPDGSIILPHVVPPPSDGMVATFGEPRVSSDIGIMEHKRPLKVRPNHFEPYYAAVHTGSVLNDFVANHLMAEQEFVLPWGTHVKCAEVFMFVAAGGGCGWFTPYPYYVPRERWKPASMLDEE